MTRFVCAVLVAVLVSAGPGLAQQRSADLQHGIDLVRAGDFEAAIEVLRPMAQALEGLPRQIRELAQVYLYIGIAAIELDRTDAAMLAFQEAQRRDRALALSPQEFSPQVRRAFEAARSYVAAPVEAAAPPPPPATAPPAPTPDSASTAIVPVDQSDWLRREGDLTTIQAVLGAANGKCDGAFHLDRRGKTLAWRPASGQTCTGWQVPFAEVRGVAAAPEGGFVVQLRGDKDTRRVFMPQPEGDLFAGGITGLSERSLTASARVAVRTAIRTLEDGLGTGSDRSSGPSTSGPAIQVSLAELIESPGDYDGRAVRTIARLDVLSKRENQYMLYADALAVLVRPEPEIALRLRADADRLDGDEIEVVGVMRRVANPRRINRRTPEFAITVWQYDTAQASNSTPTERPLTIEGLATADPLPTDRVSVIGKFRSFNTFGDLPVGTRRSRTDWVIKDDIYSIWITGRSPSGNGFDLSALQNERDMQWLKVTGTAEERNGAIYLRASNVALSAPPSPSASVKETARVELKNIIPDVRFTSPIEGLEDVAPDGRLVIQFTKAMDESTFSGRVQLRYAGQPTATFSATSVRYFSNRRVLEVDPGVALVTGQTLECVLVSGIKDAEGNDLPAPPGTPAGVARVFRWVVAEN